MAHLGSSSRQTEQTSQWLESVREILHKRSGRRLKPRHEKDPEIQRFYATSEGEKERDNDLNPARIPYDRNRVVVEDPDRNPNASWIRELYGRQWWIAAEKPSMEMFATYKLLSLCLRDDMRPPLRLERPSSFGLGKCRIITIVQLGYSSKDSSYLPSKLGEEKPVYAPGLRDEDRDDLTLILEGREDHLTDRGYIESTVKLVKRDRKHPNMEKGGVRLKHFHFDIGRIWMYNMGVQEKADRLIQFAKRVEEVNRTNAPGYHSNPPILIQCKPVGQTGQFIALTSLLRHYGLLKSQVSRTRTPKLAESPLHPLPEELRSNEVVCEVESLRDQHYGMVQFREEFEFVFAAAEYAKTKVSLGSQTGSRARTDPQKGPKPKKGSSSQTG